MPKVLVFSGTLDPKIHFGGALARATELKKHGDMWMVTAKQALHFVL